MEGITSTYRADEEERRIDLQTDEIEGKQLRALFPRLIEALAQPGWQLVAHHAGGVDELFYPLADGST